MIRRRFLQTIALAAAPPAAPQQSRRKPNIVLIYADDVGYGDLSCYGATRVKTPNLDRLAASGVRFTHAHSSAATCTPSRYSLLTGEYAWRQPGTNVLPGDANLIVKPGRLTLPAMLKQAGYSTGVVGKWHLGLGGGKIDWNTEIKPGPLEIGFDYSFIIPATGDRVPCVYVENHRVANLDPRDPIRVAYDNPFPGDPTGLANPELLKMHPSHGHNQAIVNGISRIGYMSGGKSARWVDEEMAGVLAAKGRAFIDRQKRDPFFLYFATHDIHVPRVPHPRFAGKSGMGPRGDAILQLDWSVGQILDALDRNRLTNDTLVIFSSDNGPVVDDGYKDDAAEKLGNHKPAGNLRGGKYSAFNAGTRVPFIVRWPDRVKRDRISSALISQVDFLSSLASLAGVKIPEEAGPDSFNVLPALLGESQPGRDSLIVQAGVRSVIEGDWKLIPSSNLAKVNRNTNIETGNDSVPQLYNLAQDPGERSNLASQHPERVAAMTALLDRIRERGRSRN
jgi:arylsulfatase A-like enzyme